ncbi:hypothetical protein AB996_1139 [Lactococcus cremoris]|uniref:Uncharacterized protein n=1 Tax=Lactococcus lactis subsp. cremoris TaxID=1359 RepID=A0A166JTZ8_LACLC|nr:LPXTG cell wall anchor domain-containing protein [Lactococcus cremoris]KZK06643.1 hypothetical protein AB996_1139 [Lactococcus cremoris]
MYRSKHQKGYKTSHEVQTTHFRTWKSGKKWLYGATSFMLLAGGIEPAFTPLMLKTTQAATVSSGQLISGGSYNTGGAQYSGAEFSNANNYKLYGTAAISGNWLNLVSNTSSSVGIGIFNGSVSSISASTGFKLSATIKVDDGTLGNFEKAGDALGFILTGASGTQLAANAQSTNASGSGLGIRNLPNTVFLGRDLYSNLTSDDGSSTNGVDGSPSNGWQSGGGNVIAIRSTNSAGVMANANYPTGTTTGTTTGQAWMQADDSNLLAGIIQPSTVQEPVSVSWTPDATNTAGTGFTSGTLSFSLTSDNSPLIGSAKTYTITTHTNLQNSLTIGFVGGTGGNYGNLSVSLNGATITGYKGAEPVLVNYLNKNTGSAIPAMSSASTITANVNDTIGAALSAPTPTSSDANTYTYVVPAAPSGYTANTVSGATTIMALNPATTSSATVVTNFIQGTANPNVLNVAYTPNSQSATFNYSLAAGTTGSAWGATSSASVTSGYTDGAIAAPSVTSAASGYTTSYVYNNSSYSTLTSAESAYASSYSAVAGTFAGANPNPTFTLVASANSQAVTTTTAWTASNAPGASSAAATGSLQAGLPSATQYASTTGSSVTTGTVLSSATYWNSMGRTSTNIPAGYNIATINYNGYTLSQAYTTSGAATSMYLMSGSSVLASSAGSNLASYAYSAISSSAQPAMVSAFTVPASSTEMDFTYAANSTAQGEIYLKTQTASGASLTSGASSSGGTKYNYYAPNSTYNAATAPTSAGFSNTQNTWRVTTGEYYNSYAVFPTDASLAVKGYSYSVLVLTSGGATSAFAPTDAMWSSAAAAGASGSLLSGSAGSTTALSGYDFTTMASATSLATVAYNTTAGNSTGKVANFAVVYTPLAPTVNTKNTLLAVGSSWKRPDNISSVTDGNGTSTDSNYINQQINATVTGPNGYSGTTVQTNVPGTYTITYTYTDPVNGATTTKTATVTVVGAYGFNTSVGLDQGLTGAEINQSFGENSYASPNDVNVIADNTPFTSLATGATVTNATVSNLQFTDNNGDSATPNLQLSDITVTNAGKVEIASGKLNQSGTYSFLVTYTYTNSAGQTVSVSTTDTINVVPPFELPFTGGSGNQFLYLMISLAAIGALGLYFSKRRKEEELEFVPEQADYGVSTPNKGKKARFLHTLRKTRPYRKVFHSKNRIHLAQTQRKEGKK